MIQSTASVNSHGNTRKYILIYIALFSLTAVAMTPRVASHQRERKIAETRATMNRVAEQVIKCADSQGTFPRTDVVMRHLGTGFTDRDEQVIDHWPGKQPLDAWGNELIYWYPGTYNAHTFDLASAGPDGVLGNDDDITNWQR